MKQKPTHMHSKSNRTGSSTARPVSWLGQKKKKVQPAVGNISESQHWPSECPKHFSIPPHSHTSYRKRNSKTIWFGRHTVWIRRQLRSRWAVGAYLLQIWPLLWQNVIVNINLHVGVLTSVWSLTAVIPWSKWASVKQTASLRSVSGWGLAGEWLLGHTGNLLPSL